MGIVILLVAGWGLLLWLAAANRAQGGRDRLLETLAVVALPMFTVFVATVYLQPAAGHGVPVLVAFAAILIASAIFWRSEREVGGGAGRPLFSCSIMFCLNVRG